MKAKIILLALCMLHLFMACQTATKKSFYIATTASQQTNTEGSIEHPFSSFQDAYTAIKAYKKEHSKAHVTLYFREGSYFFQKGYLLDTCFSNTTLTAYHDEQVSFTGALTLLPTSIEKQADSPIQRIDLAATELQDYGSIHNIGFSRPSQNAGVELFINNQPLHLARWPNKGTIKMGKIIDTGSIPRNGDFSKRGAIMAYDSIRISKWKETDDKWITGYFKYGYADDALRIQQIDTKKKQLTTDGPTLYGFDSSSPWNRYHFFNVKEELDQAGEFYIDKDKQELLFISPEKDIQSLQITQLAEPFFDIWKATNITIQNITFECSRAAILSLVETENCVISNCTFRNSGNIGIIVGLGISPFEQLKHEGTGTPIRGTIGSLAQHIYANNTFNRLGGKNNTIKDCLFYNLGAGAISLGGGNRLTLKAGNNSVTGCTFHDNNRIERSYRPAIDITGVGNKVMGCEIYNTPSMALLLHGNNHLIEDNYIHHVCLEVEDQGAFYYGRNPSECGTILHSNIFANIPSTYSTCAVYNDDGAGGLLVEGNLFYKAGRYGVLLGGGSNNTYSNNIFVGMPYGFHIDNRLQNWSKSLIEPNGLFEKRLKEVNYNADPYRSTYPYLTTYLPNTGVPTQNRVDNNFFINVEKRADSNDFLIFRHNKVRNDSILLMRKEEIEQGEDALSDANRKAALAFYHSLLQKYRK